MDHVLAGLQSAEADNDNRRAWDRWTRAIRGRPKGSRDLDDTICGSVGETGRDRHEIMNMRRRWLTTDGFP
jgi:hypothetical protein